MIGETLGPYRILERVGAGGMGEVFLAEDPRLGRRVAIKRPTESTFGAADARERLRREAHAAAQLNHPNVAAIYDIIDLDGLPYIVMEYVEGRTLAAAARGTPLPPEQALAIARQIADALVDAHAHGVIHRDLKPANVMLTTGGRVKVLDFGLARQPTVVAASGGDVPSVATHVWGTPGYMAPEQLMGDRGDARSDIYSFGALLFELLTGAAPFPHADRLEHALEAAKSSGPPRPKGVNPAVPAALDDLVVRALALRPDDRFQNAEQLSLALARAASEIADARTAAAAQRRPGVRPSPASSRRWAAALVGVLTLIALILFLRGRDTGPAPVLGGSKVVAVLPFEITKGEAELETLSAGLADLIVNGLAATDNVTAVPPRETAAPRSSQARDVRRVARDLGASHLVECALQRTADGIQLTVRVIPAQRGASWERSYPGRLDDVLTLGRRILDDLVVQLGAASPQNAPVVTSVEAFQQYSQAREMLDRRDLPGNIDRAIELLQSATRRSSNFALAHAALGEAYFARYTRTNEPTWVDQAQKELLIALSTDANQPLVRLTLATIFSRTGKRDLAEKELRTLIQTKPSDAAHRELGIILIERGDADEGLAELQRAIDLRPGYWRNYLTKGAAALRLGRYDEAERSFVRVTELQPDNATAHGYLGTLYLLTDRREKAIDSLRRAIKSSPTSDAWSNLGTALSEGGDEQQALAAYRQAVDLKKLDPVLHRNVGDSLTRLNRGREARAEFTQCAKLARDALQVDSRSVANHGILAVCLAKLGQFDEALEHVEATVRLAPNANEPYRRKAAVLALAGRPDEAIAALREARARGLNVALIARDDDFKPLRGLKAYQDLVKTGA